MATFLFHLKNTIISSACVFGMFMHAANETLSAREGRLAAERSEAWSRSLQRSKEHTGHVDYLRSKSTR